MKIAFISFEYPPLMVRGSATYTVNITRELARQNNEVHIITPRVKGYSAFEIIDGVNIHRLNFIDRPFMRAPSFWLSLVNRFKDIEKTAGNFDIIHGNGTSDLSLAKMLTGNIKRVVTVHHLASDVVQAMGVSAFSRIKDINGETGLLPYLENYNFQRADKLIAVSKYTRGQLVNKLHIPLSKIEMIYSGCEVKDFNFPPKEKDELRSRYAIDGNKPVLLFVGKIDDERKGLLNLLRAFGIASNRMDLQLIVAGQGNRDGVIRHMPSVGPGSRIIITGFVDDDVLEKLYAICDVYVCPSRLEGFGLTILDAMAAGKPVIATCVGAIPEIISAGENGILVPDNDETALAAAIVQMLSDTVQANKFAENNRRKVIEQYRWEDTAKLLINTYVQLIDR